MSSMAVKLTPLSLFPEILVIGSADLHVRSLKQPSQSHIFGKREARVITSKRSTVMKLAPAGNDLAGVEEWAGIDQN
jgi:hypothetical protein